MSKIYDLKLLGDGGKILGDAGQKSKLLGDGGQILGGYMMYPPSPGFAALNIYTLKSNIIYITAGYHFYKRCTISKLSAHIA